LIVVWHIDKILVEQEAILDLEVLGSRSVVNSSLKLLPKCIHLLIFLGMLLDAVKERRLGDGCCKCLKLFRLEKNLMLLFLAGSLTLPSRMQVTSS
jgi:hypothetical protein